MSSSRITKAEEVLRLAEMAARNMHMPLNDDDPGIRAKQEAFSSIVGKISYLKKQASALWKPAFESVLDNSHSMRVELIDASKSKELLRPLKHKCMACGRAEKSCRFKVDLAGNFDSAAWCRDAADVTDAYTKFIHEYSCESNEALSYAELGKVELPPVDKGVYVIGATCLRKAILRYKLQTFMMELCRSADRDMGSISSGTPASNFRRDRFYTVTAEKTQALVDEESALELAIADGKRPMSPPRVDHGFWEILDNVRSSVAGGDEATLDRLLVKRATCTMSGCSRATSDHAHADSSADEEWWSESDDEEGEEGSTEVEERVRGSMTSASSSTLACEADEQCMRTRSGATFPRPVAGFRSSTSRCSPPKRPRRTVVGDESDEDGAAQPPEPMSAAPTLRKPRRAVVADESDEDGAEPLRSPTPVMGGRQASASGIAGINRAAGILPSRRAALIALMNLQTKLFVKGESGDAIVCTNAIQTIQELMDRVEKLSHTAGI